MTDPAPLLVVLDGPAGAGKSTVSRALARRLGLPLLDTGAIYRTLALVAGEDGVSWDDEPGLVEVCTTLGISFGSVDAGPQRVLARGRDVTSEIRTPKISDGASRVSRHPRVREALLPIQRRLGAQGCVAEGRDMGTVVFPDAPLKFFLTADLETRAKRRHRELAQRDGDSPALDEVARTMEQRDTRDRERDVAPLSRADDAVSVDTSGMAVDAVIEHILGLIAARRD